MAVHVADVDGAWERLPAYGFPAHQGVPSDGDSPQGGIHIPEEQVGSGSVTDLGHVSGQIASMKNGVNTGIAIEVSFWKNFVLSVTQVLTPSGFVS